MKYLLPLAVLTLAVGSARAETIVLFDGKDASKWVITGEHKIEDGVLIVGGTGAASLRPPIDLSGEWTLEIEERHSGSCGYQMTMSRFMGKGSMSSSSTGVQDQWLKTIYSVTDGSQGYEFRHGYEGSTQPSVSRIGSEVTDFAITLGPGTTMEIRSAKITITPVSPLKRLFVPIVSLVSLLILIALLVWFRRRLRPAQE